MTADPPDEPAAPAARPGDAPQPQRRRRSVRSQSALAVVGRSAGTPYSAWADSYLRKPDLSPLAPSECTTAQTGIATDSGSLGSGSQPQPDNPFDVARRGEDSPPSAAAWRHRATMSEVTLRHQSDATGVDADLHVSAASSQKDSAAAQWRPGATDLDDHAGQQQQPARVRRAGHSRRHSDASVLRHTTAAGLERDDHIASPPSRLRAADTVALSAELSRKISGRPAARPPTPAGAVGASVAFVAPAGKPATQHVPVASIHTASTATMATPMTVGTADDDLAAGTAAGLVDDEKGSGDSAAAPEQRRARSPDPPNPFAAITAWDEAHLAARAPPPAAGAVTAARPLPTAATAAVVGVPLAVEASHRFNAAGFSLPGRRATASVGEIRLAVAAAIAGQTAGGGAGGAVAGAGTSAFRAGAGTAFSRNHSGSSATSNPSGSSSDGVQWSMGTAGGAQFLQQAAASQTAPAAGSAPRGPWASVAGATAPSLRQAATPPVDICRMPSSSAAARRFSPTSPLRMESSPGSILSAESPSSAGRRSVRRGSHAVGSDGSKVRGLDVRMAAAYALRDAGGSLPHRRDAAGGSLRAEAGRAAAAATRGRGSAAPPAPLRATVSQTLAVAVPVAQDSVSGPRSLSSSPRQTLKKVRSVQAAERRADQELDRLMGDIGALLLDEPSPGADWGRAQSARP